ncbi:MAG: hypothetical protein FWG74_04525, partial [Planctomycetes bacterium]|nr:hypothetical protein [Planctomycetota bacterium]
DQFSLGASLYEAVTGRKPFEGSSISDILMKRFFEKPAPAWSIGRGKTSRGFSAVLAKMLSRSPENRYQSFEELVLDFDRIGAGEKPVVATAASLAARAAPRLGDREGSGYSGVISRVNEPAAQARWRVCSYSSLLFLALLGIYGLTGAGNPAAPAPLGQIRHDLLIEAESLPDSVEESLRDAWAAAFRLMLRAEQAPEARILRQAIAGLRALTETPEFAGTIYVQAAEQHSERLRRLLEEWENSRLEAGD